MKPVALALSAALILPGAVCAQEALSPAPAPTSASIAFDFNLGAETGQVMIALFDSQAAYDGGRPVRVAALPVSGREARAVFDALPAGEYGMKAFHDIDGDGQMNANPFGMPTEPFAFSNNAVGNMGPAGWDRARFTVSGATVQTIELR